MSSNKTKDYEFICKNCNKKYYLSLTEDAYKKINRKFCCIKCSVEWHKNNYLECPYCGKICTVNGILTHIWRVHTKSGKEFNKNVKLEKTKKRWYEFQCPKCKKIHKKFLSECEVKNLKGYCSYKCSNSRNHSKKTKEKISNSLQKLKSRQCKLCGIDFLPRCSTQKYCGLQCSYASVRHKIIESNKNRNASKISKNTYKNGRKLSGGKTKWIDFKDFKVQGNYELRTCYILEAFKILKKIKDWEYVNDTNDRFQYIGIDGKEHTYITDFKVYLHDNSFYYIEVKGYLRKPDKRKIQSVKNLGYKIIVWTLKDIKQYEMSLWCNLESLMVWDHQIEGSNPSRLTEQEINKNGIKLLTKLRCGKNVNKISSQTN